MVTREQYVKINNLCEYYNIHNYKITNEGVVNVVGDVIMVNEGLKKIPIIFGKVTGNFMIYENSLKNLENSPNWVGGIFDCSDNILTSLLGAPKHVGSSIDISNNELSNLNYLPIEIKSLNFNYNPIRSLYLDYDVKIGEMNAFFNSLQLPDRLENIDLKVFLKYQNQYDVCKFVKGKPLVNEENLLIFLEDIKEGLQ